MIKFKIKLDMKRINGFYTKRIPCRGEYYATPGGKIFNGKTGRQMKLLLQGKKGKKYYAFRPCENAVAKNKTVHRATYQAWIGPIPADKVIDHKDRDKLNNRSSNLSCVTNAHNLQNNNAKGVYPTPFGTFQAIIIVNGHTYNKTKKTMAEAQAWRAMMKAQLCPHTVV